MAEDKKKPSWDDFVVDDENLLKDDLEEEQEDQDLPDEEEEEEVQPPVKKVKKVKAETKKEDNLDEVEEEVKETKVEKKETSDTLEEEEESTDDYAVQFLSEVQKLTGHEVEVDYGDIDPVSPQGIALREKAVKEYALNNFLEELEQNFPQVYKALEYANNGGDPAELFKQTTSRDYSKVTLNEGDTALAKEILKEYYQARGIKNEGRIAKLLEIAEESEEGLIKEAQSAVSELAKEQEEAKAELLKTQEQKALEQRKRDQVFLASLDEVLDRKQLGSFKIADNIEAKQFRQFVISNIRRSDDGGYQLVNKIEPAEMERLLQYQYFQFKKGDLSKIIQQKAATEKAKSLSLRMKAEVMKPKRSSETTQNSKLSLRDFER